MESPTSSKDSDSSVTPASPSCELCSDGDDHPPHSHHHHSQSGTDHSHHPKHEHAGPRDPISGLTSHGHHKHHHGSGRNTHRRHAHTPKFYDAGTATATEEEWALVEKMRGVLPEELRESAESHAMLRFLRARKMKVEKAAKQFAEAMEWRAEKKADELHNSLDPKEEIFDRLAYVAYHKFDREGRPIYIEKTGAIQISDMLRELGEEALIERHIRHMEILAARAEESSHKLGHVVDKYTIILDMKGFSLNPVKHAGALSVFRECSRLDQAYHPERLHRLFVINAPFVFRMIWGIVTPWIDAVTRAKWVVCGSNYSAQLLADIPEENLPAEYGGKCTCEGGCIVAKLTKFPGYENVAGIR